MKESALETALRTIPGDCTIKLDGGYGLRLCVLDCVGTKVLSVDCRSSNSGATLGLWISKMTYLKKWDEVKVTSMVLYGFYARASSAPKKTYERQILADLRRDYPKYKQNAPGIVNQVVAHIREHYIKTRGEDIKMAIERVKKEFNTLKEHVSEEELLQWFRETQVQAVMES